MTFAGLPHHQKTIIRKFHEDDPGPDAVPYETLVVDHGWFEADGTSVTDPGRIAELERSAALMGDGSNANRSDPA